MTPEQIDRVFGRGRLKMATGEHVEVFREAVATGERRRYTKRFLRTGDADFGQWTEREWRILARLIGHGIRCVPDVVQFDGGAMGGMRLVQTYDAGVTVDQWATLLPVGRNGSLRRHVFEDCAHWWALAHYCLSALSEIHALQLVHLDIKGDNICIPYGPANFDPESSELRLYPIFAKLALIDFAFSLVSHESLATPLPIGWQKDYDYQSPRLLRALEAGRSGDLQPTRELDWRCDLYSLAAMLKRYLPAEDRAPSDGDPMGWTPQRYDDARALIYRLRDCHDRDVSPWRPHQQLMDLTAARIAESDLAASLDYGWTLAREEIADGTASPLTPMTRIAPSLRPTDAARIATPIVVPTAVTAVLGAARVPPPRRRWAAKALPLMIVALSVLAAPSFIGDPARPLADGARHALDAMRSMFAAAPREPDAAESDPPTAPPARQTDSLPEATAVDRTAAQAPAASPVAAPDSARTEPAGVTASSPPEQKAPAARVAEARAKSLAPANRAQAAPRSSRSVTATPRHPLPRWAFAGSVPNQPRATSSASVSAAKRSTSRPSSVAQARSQSSPPVKVAAVAPTRPQPQSSAPATTPATETPRIAQVNAAPEPRAVQSSPAGNASVAVASAAAVSEEPAAAVKPHAVEPAPSDRRSAQVTASAQGSRSQPSPQRHDDFFTQLSNLWALARDHVDPPAPVEERSPAASVAQAATSRAPVRSAPDSPARAGPESIQPARPAPPAPVELSRAHADALANAAPPLAPPTLIAQPRVPTNPSGTLPPPAQIVNTSARPSNGSQDQLALQARRLLADTVPRVASQAQADASRVLRIASVANQPSERQSIVDAVYATWPSESASIPAANVPPSYARALHDDAHQAFVSRNRDAASALNIELRAFGANPGDPDIAGYLAFLHLRMNPAQPETARQLALYAIALSGARRSARPDDWSTLAIANALTGRETDATDAFLVEVALTSNLDRSCRAALSAYASFGERLRAPVQAMFYRIRTQGRGYESPSCARAPYWSAANATWQ